MDLDEPLPAVSVSGHEVRLMYLIAKHPLSRNIRGSLDLREALAHHITDPNRLLRGTVRHFWERVHALIALHVERQRCREPVHQRLSKESP